MTVDVEAQRRSRRRRRTWIAARYALLTFLAFVVLFPVYMTVVNSLLPAQRILERPPALFPTSPKWGQYADAWTDGNLGQYLRTSFIVTIAITIAQVITSVLAAYAFAFLDFPFKRTIFVVFLTTLMVPFEVTIITNFQTVSDLGWLNSYQGLVVPFLATGFGAFLLRQAFLTLPKDLEEAARLDGYGHWRFLARIVVPLSRPAIGALSVFSFLLAWNQYLWPLLIADNDDYRTVQVGLRQLSRTNLSEFPTTFAGTILAALPLVILLIVFSKQLVRGLTAGAVKG
ncbi:MAG TPA: carbohydrate ABC transporter permease [Acidimicrobiia bacterium]|nr:carbohydrate ABC transporter permease [Acidimicrobiia bacterium]